MSETPNKIGRANRRHASPLKTGAAIRERLVYSTVPISGDRLPLALRKDKIIDDGNSRVSEEFRNNAIKCAYNCVVGLGNISIF